MSSQFLFRYANENDVEKIFDTLRSNLAEKSLFQQSLKQIQRNISEFILIEDFSGSLLGCAQIHWHSAGVVEILAFSIRPKHQSSRAGQALMIQCIELIMKKNFEIAFGATAKPNYFSRFGFERISKRKIPISVLMHKLIAVFHQPISRWLPALFGRHAFMKLNTDKYQNYLKNRTHRGK